MSKLEKVVITLYHCQKRDCCNFPCRIKISLHLDLCFTFQNEISVIESGAFSNIPQLIELKLSNNELTKVPRLSQAKNLQLLDLANNK